MHVVRWVGMNLLNLRSQDDSDGALNYFAHEYLLSTWHVGLSLNWSPTSF